jgi:hypothetical protein
MGKRSQERVKKWALEQEAKKALTETLVVEAKGTP